MMVEFLKFSIYLRENGAASKLRGDSKTSYRRLLEQ